MSDSRHVDIFQLITIYFTPTTASSTYVSENIVILTKTIE